jgi:Flp pilus assembly protein TadD
MRSGQLDKAGSVLMQALKGSPDDVELNLMLGILRCQEGNYQAAIKLLGQLSEREPANSRVRVALGAAYLAAGQHSRARMELDMAVGLDPDSSEAHYDLAQVLLTSTPPDPEGAESHYKNALSLGAKRDPDFEKRLQTAMGGSAKTTPRR